MATVAARAVTLTREGNRVRLAFPYDPDLVNAAKSLPYAVFDPETKTWTATWCTQTVDALRALYHGGHTDVSVDELIEPGEVIEAVKAAQLHAGTAKRPYAVSIGIKDEVTYTRLRAVLGASWDKRSHTLTYPAASAPALAELVQRGIIDDPDGVLSRTSDAVVMYDSRSGKFAITATDRRAQAAFDRHFPHTDVIAAWREKNLSVEFLDTLSEQMYAGELARHNPAPDPEGLKFPLFEYQRRNYSIAITREGHAVFDEPGLGKTATGIATGLHLLNTGQVSRVVVVAPAAVRTQWAAEIERFTGMSDIAVVGGNSKARHAAYADGLNCRWVVMHYDILARDTDALRPLFADALIIADEAHRIKSRTAARTKALKSLSHSAKRRLALTGTPVETNPGEWYEILSGWASPGCLGSVHEFNERYRWKNRWGGYEGARNVAELRERSLPWYSRHTKSQVAKHLPPLRVQHLILDPDPAYAAALRRAHAEAAEEIRAARVEQVTKNSTLVDETEVENAEAGAMMTAVGMLRALCTSPRIVHESTSSAAETMSEAGLIPDEDGPKIDEVRSICAGLRAATQRRREDVPDEKATAADVDGERVVIFTYSERAARLIHERLTEDGVPSVLFTGATSTSERDRAVATFTDPTADVCAFIATDAAAEGLNLGKCCSLLVNVDLAWTASRMAQRAQRIHRIDGKAEKYLVINLTIAGTLEAGIVRLLDARADLTDALFGELGSKAKTTGKRGRNLYEEVLASWPSEEKANEKDHAKSKNPGKRAESEDVDDSAQLDREDSSEASDADAVAAQPCEAAATEDGEGEQLTLT